MHERESVDAGQHPLQTGESAASIRYVYLGRVAGDDDFRTEPDAREEHLHLLGCRVLCFVENDEAVVQGSPAHECERCHFHHSPFKVFLCVLGTHHVVQRVVERTQVRVDLRHEVARQKAQAFARLDGRTRENDAIDGLCVQCLHCHRHR